MTLLQQTLTRPQGKVLFEGGGLLEDLPYLGKEARHLVAVERVVHVAVHIDRHIFRLFSF